VISDDILGIQKHSKVYEYRIDRALFLHDERQNSIKPTKLWPDGVDFKKLNKEVIFRRMKIKVQCCR
jgi:hypothetical protein